MPTYQASWNGQLIAKCNDIVLVENNPYFPEDSIDKSYIEPSNHKTTCPWKGTAHYYHLIVDGQTNQNAAWFYPEPKDAAKEIKNRIAFWKGVKVEQVDQ